MLLCTKIPQGAKALGNRSPRGLPKAAPIAHQLIEKSRELAGFAAGTNLEL
jgi:hypothetical protein